MVAIKLIVASLASLAVAHPIEPRAVAMNSELSGLVSDIGNTVGSLLGNVQNANKEGIVENLSDLLTDANDLFQQLGELAGRATSDLGSAIDDLSKNNDLTSILEKFSTSLEKVEQLPADDVPVASSLLSAINDVREVLTRELGESVSEVTVQGREQLRFLEERLNTIMEQIIKALRQRFDIQT